ncbi:MAG: ECF-type sigma factor [Planctomycetota bacterium]
MEDEPISEWIQNLKEGDSSAAEDLWRVFFERVRQYARGQLGHLPKRVADEDDLAITVFHAVVAGTQEGRFRQMESRRDFWKLLVVIASRKASNLRRKQAQRREAGESALIDASQLEELHPMQNLQDHRDEFIDIDAVYGACEDLLSELHGSMRRVALLRLEGHTNEEISKIIGRSVKTVEHYFNRIRNQWQTD